MSLIKKSKKSEMPMNQNLGMAYGIKRKAKKMAEGGAISASNEKRPMPSAEANDKAEVSKNSSQKAPRNDSAMDTPERKQSMKGKTSPLKHPKMVPINGASLRLRGQEDDLEMSEAPASPDEQPSESMDEEGADRKGPDATALKQLKGTMKYAMGGKIAEEDGEEHPAGLESDDDMMAPPQDEFMSGHEQLLAEGGDVSEEEVEHAASIAAAIMAKRRKMMAEGGQVDLSINADEEPNNEDDMSFEALKKENYSESEGLDALDQPMDSNEHSPEHEDEDIHDRSVVGQIRRKMKAKSPIKR